MSSKDGRIPLNVAVLKEQRKRIGLSQEKLAELCQEQGFLVSVSSIKRAESGMNVLYRTATNLAEFYGIAIEQLLLTDDNGDVDAQTHATLASLPFYERSLLTLVLESPEPAVFDQLATLLDGSHSHFGQQHQQLVLGWSVDNNDEYVFERISQLCASLQQRFQDSVRMFVEATTLEHSSQPLPANNTEVSLLPVSERMQTILQRVPWGQIIACPCFVSSNRMTPEAVVDPADPQFCYWYLVSTHSHDSDRFVGRQEELAALREGINRLQHSGQGRGYCLSGMAGIGKTRLLQEALEYAATTGCPLTQVQLLNHGVVDSRSPLTILSRALFGFDKDESDELIRGRIALSEIPSSHHLFIYWLMGLGLTDSEKQLLDLIDFNSLQQAIVSSVELLLNARRQLPAAIIAVEDIHWADDALMTVLKALLQQSSQTNLLLLLTFRQQNRLAVRQSWFDHVELIELDALSSAEAWELAEHMAPQQSELIRHCVELAQGHPLFLRQTLLCANLGSDIPESLEHLVIAQLKQLEPLDLEAVKSASVFGQVFGLEQLRFVVNNPGYTPERLLAKGLIKDIGQQYMFHHDLICGAVYKQLTDGELVEVNKLCASWYEPRDKYQYALHIRQAQSQDAFDVLVTTARHYLDNFQFEKALRLIEEAIAIAPPAQLAFALNFQGNCLYTMGRMEDSITSLEKALEQAQSTSGSEQEHSRYYLDLVKPYRLTDNNDKAMALLDQAQTLSEQHQQYVQLAEIHSMRGNMLFPTGQMDACEREHQQALAYSKQSGSQATIAKSLGGLGDCSYAQGKMTTGYQYLQECLQICEQQSLLNVETTNRYMLATVMIYQLASIPALQQAQQASNQAYLTANRRAEIVSRLTAGWIFLDSNALVQAENEINTALQLSEQLKASRFIAFMLESKARLLHYKGDHSGAEACIQQGLELVREYRMQSFIGPWLCATRALVSQQPEQIRAALAEGELWLQSACVGHNYLRFYQQGIQVAWQQRDPLLLQRYRTGLADFTRAEPNPWSEFHIERADLLLGLLNPQANQQTSVAELLRFNQKATSCHINQAQIDLTELQQLLQEN
ncbi:AAA family ATPase [Oceanobacter mangrovi]|uniref:AAA family ATPase n=1 Tax=Oceanobacter mangrovi TaxID=2862510 RepID=UPI001C8D2F37|nr:AAA family ATPase [Oceanobacter mangrovi]